MTAIDSEYEAAGRGAFRDTLNGYYRWAAAEMRSRLAPGPTGSQRQRPSLLLLAHCLPPDVSGGVYRPLSWLQYGANQGWRMAALAPASSRQISAAGAHLERSMPPTVSITRFRPGNEKPSWRLFPRIDGGFLNALRMFDAARRRVEPPSAIIATGPSFYPFVAGLFLSRFWRIPLVLDYRDEWTGCPFGFVSTGNMDRYWEGKCLARADRVIFTTEAQRKFRLGLFSGLASEKCHVIPNGWEPSDWLADQRKPERPGNDADAKIRIAYVGTLSDHASPRQFLAAIGSLVAEDPGLRSRLEISFVGRCSGSSRDDIVASGLGDVVKVVGELPRPEANDAMRNADVLLLIALPELARYIPGKLYEYVASGRPILVYGHEGEASRLVRQLDVGAFVPEGDLAALSHAIHALHSKVDTPEMIARRKQWLDRHSRRALAGNLFDLIEEMLREKSVHVATPKTLSDERA